MTAAMENRLRRVEQRLAVTAGAPSEIPGLPPFRRWTLADLLYGLDLGTRDLNPIPIDVGAELVDLDREEAAHQRYSGRPDVAEIARANVAAGRCGPPVQVPGGLRWPGLIARHLWYAREYPHTRRESVFFTRDGALRG